MHCAGNSFSFAMPFAAEAQTSAVAIGACPYLIDAKTGDRVPTTTIPNVTSVSNYRNFVEGPDKNHVSQAAGTSFCPVSSCANRRV